MENNRFTETTTVQIETDLTIAKSDDGSSATAGNDYIYFLTVTNNGPSDSGGGTVTDTLPGAWTYDSERPDQLL